MQQQLCQRLMQHRIVASQLHQRPSRRLAIQLCSILYRREPSTASREHRQRSCNLSAHGIDRLHPQPSRVVQQFPTQRLISSQDLLGQISGCALKLPFTLEWRPLRGSFQLFDLPYIIFNPTGNAAGPNKNPDERKIVDLYHSYMDESAIESHGLAALKPHLAEIAAIHNPRELAHALGLTLRADVDALNNTNFHTANLFGLWVAPSFNDPEHYAPYLLQGGIELPNRDYYLADSDSMKEVRAKYRTHIAAMFRLAGLSDPEARAIRVLAFETAIAKQQISLADSEDIHKANTPWRAADFTARAPGLDWPEFFRAAGLDKQDTFIVWQPTAITGEAALVASQSIDGWKDLLAYHLVEAYATSTSKALADERFAFFGTTLSGATQQRPRDFRGDVLVFTRQDLATILNDGDLAAEPAKHLAELKPDIAGTQNHQVFRQLAQFHNGHVRQIVD